MSAFSALTVMSTQRTQSAAEENLLPAGAIDDSEESSYGNSGWTFGAVRLSFVTPCSAGDVEVRPGDPIRKLFEERSRGYRPRFAPTDVLDVGDV